MINYPLKYDSVDQTIDDSEGNVVAILSWPGLKREMETINSWGEEMMDALNGVNEERMEKVSKKK